MNKSTITLYILTLLITAATAWAYHTPVEISVEARGTVRPNGDVVRIITETGGRVTEVHVREGENVREGDVLIQLDTRDLDLKRGMLERQIQTARARLAQLRHDGMPTDSLTPQLAALRHQLEESYLDLERFTIASPITGVISSIASLHAGEIVGQGAMIGTILPDGHDFVIEAWLPVTERQSVETDQVVRLELEQVVPNQPSTFDGAILSISPDAQVTESTAAYRVVVAPVTESPALLAGMTVRLHFITGRDRLLFLLLSRLKKVVA